MRFLVAGLLLIGIGVALAEYVRRHPPAASQTSGGTPAKAPAAPPSMKALLEGAAPEPVIALSTLDLQRAVDAAVPPSASPQDGFVTRLAGSFAVRELRAGSTFVVLVLEKDKQQALVRIPISGAPVVLAVRADVITATAVEGSTVFWAEGSRAYSIPAEGGPISMVAHLPKALVTSLAAKGSVLLATLIPKDVDPFSTEPSGALAQLEKGSATLIAGEQIRPHDVVTDGRHAYFAAGYPSGLVRAALDGSSSSRIAERADSPLAFDGAGIVYRYPMASAPEVRRSALAGGSSLTLARGEVDWLAASEGLIRFTTTGVGARLYEVAANAEPRELLTLQGQAKGVAVAGSALFVASTSGEGLTLVRVRP